MNTPQPLQLTDRDKGPRHCPKCGDLRETPWHDQDCSYRPESDKGEQCVYCGKDSWTCEHFEPPICDDADEWQRRSERECDYTEII